MLLAKLSFIAMFATVGRAYTYVQRNLVLSRWQYFAFRGAATTSHAVLQQPPANSMTAIACS